MRLLSAVFALALLLAGGAAWAAGKVKVYAAASLTNVLGDIAIDYEKSTGTKVITSFAGSSALAKQIEAGAPADIFISADTKWMDHLADQGLIQNASRRDLLRNELVLIAPKGEGFAVETQPGFRFAQAFDGKLCMADPDAVPAGIYGKQALIRLGWWGSVASRVVAAQDVRAALAFVERGECAAGIVYRTEALISDKVEQLATFPADSHAPIVYPAALVSGATGPGAGFLEYLGTGPAQAVFQRYGFEVSGN
jgi:molybdate transport system substrate-binding protein